MDTRASVVDAVLLDSIKRWHELAPEDATPNDDAVVDAAADRSLSSNQRGADDDHDEADDDGAANAPFRVDAHLNARVALWNGALWRLRVDAIVNSTDEALKDTSGLCRKIMDAAGAEIWTECASAGSCRTGEAVVTRGCALPARRLIHTVGPRYNLKYHNAAESALHMCYRSVLSAAVEHRLATVAFPCVYTRKKAYPRTEAAHIAVRTVRRFLEHFRDELDAVVFCVDSLEDQLIYESVLPLYFPRTRAELKQSAMMLHGRDLGDAFGEPIIEERKIRIGSVGGGGDGGQVPAQPSKRQHDNQADDAHDDLTDDENEAVQSFCEMSADPDVERLERLRVLQEERLKRASSRAHQAQQAARHADSAISYQSVLARAQQEDFADLRAMRFLYNAGVDHSGAPVIVYLASNLPVADVDLDRVMLFVIQTMDAVVENQYSVLYVHADTTTENQPTATWLKRLFRTFSAKYQRNLRFFYIYEPSVWLKLLVLLARGFVSSAFYRKMVYVESPTALDNIATKLELPPHLYPQTQAPSEARTSASPAAAGADAGAAGTLPRKRTAVL